MFNINYFSKILCYIKIEKRFSKKPSIKTVLCVIITKLDHARKHAKNALTFHIAYPIY